MKSTEEYKKEYDKVLDTFSKLEQGFDSLYSAMDEFNENGTISATTLKSKDVVIALSYTGETKEILDALKYVKENGAKIIGITMVGNNSLSKICDICIEHSSVDKGLRTYSTRSRVVQENIIDILYIGLCTKRKGFLERYYSLFAKDKEDKNNK